MNPAGLKIVPGCNPYLPHCLHIWIFLRGKLDKLDAVLWDQTKSNLTSQIYFHFVLKSTSCSSKLISLWKNNHQLQADFDNFKNIFRNEKWLYCRVVFSLSGSKYYKTIIEDDHEITIRKNSRDSSITSSFFLFCHLIIIFFLFYPGFYQLFHLVITELIFVHLKNICPHLHIWFLKQIEQFLALIRCLGDASQLLENINHDMHWRGQHWKKFSASSIADDFVMYIH